MERPLYRQLTSQALSEGVEYWAAQATTAANMSRTMRGPVRCIATAQL